MTVLDVSQHHVAMVKALLAKATLHQLQIPQLLRIRSIGPAQHALIKHVLVDFEELLLRTVYVDQSGDDIVLAPL